MKKTEKSWKKAEQSKINLDYFNEGCSLFGNHKLFGNNSILCTEHSVQYSLQCKLYTHCVPFPTTYIYFHVEISKYGGETWRFSRKYNTVFEKPIRSTIGTIPILLTKITIFCVCWMIMFSINDFETLVTITIDKTSRGRTATRKATNLIVTVNPC